MDNFILDETNIKKYIGSICLNLSVKISIFFNEMSSFMLFVAFV